MMKKVLLGALITLSLPVLAAKPEWVEDKQQGKKGASQSEMRAKPQSQNGHDRRDDDKRSEQKRYEEEKRYEERYEEKRYDDRRYDDKGSRYELRDRLSAEDRDRLLRGVLVDHYGVGYEPETKHYKSLPPGLRKKLQRGGELPPGWKDKLVRGEVIDPEVYRHAERLPSDLLNKLTGRQDGIELLRVGDSIVRVMEGRGTVVDVIDLTDRALGLFD